MLMAILVGTIWIALAAYTVAVGLRHTYLRVARLCWTCGAIALAVHILTAFHGVHHWSHAAAVLATRAQTEAVTGLAWGQGVWLNYLMTIWWLLDAALWWCWGHDRYRQAGKAWHVSRDGFFIFMIFNATIVFEQGAVRWFGCAICLCLAWFLRPRASIANHARSKSMGSVSIE